MAQVVFVTGLADKLGYATRLLRKKHREGARVAVFGPAPLLQRLDHALWADEPLSFLPHLRLRSSTMPPVAQISRTPIWLLDAPLAELNCDSAVNLGAELALAQGFERVAELVGQDEAERRAGRLRWKALEAAGHQLSHHPQAG